MTATTSVPSITFGASGILLPQESDILNGALADMNAAFGGDLNPALETPQGQIASSLTAIIGEKNDQIAYITNQVDPANAQGRFQDAIGRIYFIERNPAEPTVVQVSCMGLALTVIAVGAKVKGDDGNIYACTQAGTIPVGGTITLPFANLTAGPLAVPGAVSIYQTITGWDSATLVSGVVGSDVESQSDFEIRRRASVALNAHGSLASIKAAVLQVSGVLDCYATENFTGSAATKGATSKSLAAHSLYVAAVGGSDADVAAAIWSKKDVGCDMVGNTTVTVTDSEGYSPPYPTYAVTFQRPSTVPIKIAVVLAANAAIPANYSDLIKAALLSAFVGGDGLPRARIGSTIFASRFYSPVAALGSFALIKSILVGTSSATLNSVDVGIDQVPTLAAADIAVSNT
jgi:uncharacterized phage protein gp47/JayE